MRRHRREAIEWFLWATAATLAGLVAVAARGQIVCASGQACNGPSCRGIGIGVGLRSSFVPPRPQRELRDLTRHRAQLQGERTRVANRIHKLLEDANLKLGAVASDILGVSGREILDALVAGEENAATLARSARGRMKPKTPQLELALQGAFRDHHRFMLKQLLEHLDPLDQQIGQFSERIEEMMGPFVDAALQERLDAIPGVDVTTIQNVIAEVGVQMDQFLAPHQGNCPTARLRPYGTPGNP